MYLVAAGLVISTAIAFIIFGEAKVQDWNYPDVVEKEKKGSKGSTSQVAVISTKPLGEL